MGPENGYMTKTLDIPVPDEVVPLPLNSGTELVP